jgi:hypothetical protein
MPVHSQESRFLGFSFPAPNLSRARFPHGIPVPKAVNSRRTVPTFCRGNCLLIIRQRGHYGWALRSSAKFFAQ